MNSHIYTYSSYNNCSFEISTSQAAFYKPSKNANSFLNQVTEDNPEAISVKLIPSDQKKVLYIVEAIFPNDLIVRFYASSNKIYQMLFKGADHSLAATFFDSMKITY